MGLLNKALAGAGQGLAQAGQTVGLEALRASVMAERDAKLNEYARKLQTEVMLPFQAAEKEKERSFEAPLKEAQAGSLKAGTEKTNAEIKAIRDAENLYTKYMATTDPKERESYAEAIRVRMGKEKQDQFFFGPMKDAEGNITGYKAYSKNTGQPLEAAVDAEGAMNIVQATERATAEAKDKAGWFTTDQADFGGSREHWITNRAKELVTGVKPAEAVDRSFLWKVKPSGAETSKKVNATDSAPTGMIGAVTSSAPSEKQVSPPQKESPFQSILGSGNQLPPDPSPITLPPGTKFDEIRSNSKTVSQAYSVGTQSRMSNAQLRLALNDTKLKDTEREAIMRELQERQKSILTRSE